MTKIIQIISYPKACSTKITQLLARRINRDAYHEPFPSSLSSIIRNKDVVIVKNTVDHFYDIEAICQSEILSRVQQPIIFITMSPIELFLSMMKHDCLGENLSDVDKRNAIDYSKALALEIKSFGNETANILKNMKYAWEELKDKDTLCFTKDQLMTDPISVTDEIIDKLGMESYSSELELAPMEPSPLGKNQLETANKAKYWLTYNDPWVNEKARTDQYFKPSAAGFNQEEKIDEVAQILFDGVSKKIEGINLDMIKQVILESLEQFELEVNKQDLHCNFEKD